MASTTLRKEAQGGKIHWELNDEVMYMFEAK
jgi:hypothetical protein